MKLVLTDSVTKLELVADTDRVMLMEPNAAGGTHIVFDPAMGRNVDETIASICAIMGVISVPASKAAFAADVAKGPKKK